MPQSMTEIAETAAAIRLRYTTTKPIVVSFMGKSIIQPGTVQLRQADVTNTEFPEPAVREVAFSHYAEWTLSSLPKPWLFTDVDRQR